MSSPDILTDKQLEVLRLAADGLCSKETARRLGVSVESVKDRRVCTLRVLHCKNITQAVHVAHVRGLMGGAA